MLIIIYLLSMISVLTYLYIAPKWYGENVTNGDICITIGISIIPVINSLASALLITMYLANISGVITSSNWWNKTTLHGNEIKPGVFNDDSRL